MAVGSTYIPIATTTFSSATSTYTFSAIPSTYTDLVLIISGQDSTVTGGYSLLRFNSDSGTNYSRNYITGNGTTAPAGRQSNESAIYPGIGGNNVGTSILSIMNYANTSVYKSSLGVYTTDQINSVRVEVNTWRSTAAINSITITPSFTTITANTMLTLYGIAAA